MWTPMKYELGAEDIVVTGARCTTCNVPEFPVILAPQC